MKGFDSAPDEAGMRADADPKPRRLTKNAAECRACGDLIESCHRHDWVECHCGAIFVDGGLAYQRGGYDKAENFIDRSEWTEA